MEFNFEDFCLFSWVCWGVVGLGVFAFGLVGRVLLFFMLCWFGFWICVEFLGDVSVCYFLLGRYLYFQLGKLWQEWVWFDHVPLGKMFGLEVYDPCDGYNGFCCHGQYSLIAVAQ